MKTIRTICRILVGIVFIYSGFVKGIDPLGFSYKFHDYFAAFHMNFLQFLDMPLSIFFPAAEFLIGVAMILGIRMSIASWALLLFMIFFTILTFILAVFNPVSDCGCFGDAIKLTNWQTFDKNIVFLGITLVIFFGRKKYPEGKSILEEWLMLVIVLGGFLGVMNYCLNHLPIIDFRPYKVGTDIVKSMATPPGAPQDSIRSVLTYKKNGELKDVILRMENTLWPDSSWKWVETKNVVIKEGYKPPIHDFSIKTFDGNDLTNDILADHEFSFILIARDLSAANKKGLYKANELAKFCKTTHFKFYGLTSSSYTEVDNLKKSLTSDIDFFVTDGTTLKTMNRANPGMMLIREGIVLAQWHYNDFPSPAELNGNLMVYTLGMHNATAANLTGWVMIFMLLSVLLAFRIYQLRKIV